MVIPDGFSSDAHHWDVHREKAIANTLVTEEGAEEALDKFEWKDVKAQLDSFTPFHADEYTPPETEEAEAIEKLKKEILSSPARNYVDISVDPRTYAKSLKLQVSTPDGVWDLLNNWACAEARDVSSVAAVAIEAGIRALKSEEGSGVALDAYEKQCYEVWLEPRPGLIENTSLNKLPF